MLSKGNVAIILRLEVRYRKNLAKQKRVSSENKRETSKRVKRRWKRKEQKEKKKKTGSSPAGI